MKKTVLAVVAAISLIRVCAGGEQLDAPIDGAAIKNFFEEFRVACNEKDVEKVKKMVGRNWDYWSCNIDNSIKFESIEILDVVPEEATKVIARVSAVDGHGNRSTPQMVFTVIRRDGAYFIEKIAVPEVDKRNQEFKAADNVVEKLIAAISAQDMDAVKATLVFGDNPAFETELSSRGLSWITNAVKNQIQVPRRGSGVSRGNEYVPLVGRVCVPRSPGGTNVLEQFISRTGRSIVPCRAGRRRRNPLNA